MQDLGVGISHYFELLRTMAGLFVIMFLFGIPSLIITFTANPDAVSDAIKAAVCTCVKKRFPHLREMGGNMRTTSSQMFVFTR
jgi:hypothetical protein